MKKSTNKAVVFGGSAGAVVLLFEILKNLSPDFPYPLIIAIHRPEHKESEMKNVFQARCQLPVIEPLEKESIKDGTVYLSPSGYHMVIEPNYQINLDSSPLVHFSRPSIDVLFLTAADVYKENLTGIIVTGTNKDGAQGLKHIHELGGTTIVQQPNDAKLSRMPEAALEATEVDHILTMEGIIDYLNKM